MGDNINRVIVAIVSIFILFIFPVYISYEKKDDIAYALALRHTQDFVDKARSKGYITKELYEDYLQKLYATGNLYDIELTHNHIRFDKVENENETETVIAKRNVEVFTTDYIINILDKTGIYTMNEGDNFNIVIKNSNVTLATVLYNMVTMNMSKNNIRIYVDYGGNILADKWYSQNFNYVEYEGTYYTYVTETVIPDIVPEPEPEPTPEPSFVCGDVDGDGEVNISDLITLSQYVSDYQNVTINEKAADVNGDGEVNIFDLTVLSPYLSGYQDAKLECKD